MEGGGACVRGWGAAVARAPEQAVPACGAMDCAAQARVAAAQRLISERPTALEVCCLPLRRRAACASARVSPCRSHCWLAPPPPYMSAAGSGRAGGGRGRRRQGGRAAALHLRQPGAVQLWRAARRHRRRRRAPQDKGAASGGQRALHLILRRRLRRGGGQQQRRRAGVRGVPADRADALAGAAGGCPPARRGRARALPAAALPPTCRRSAAAMLPSCCRAAALLSPTPADVRRPQITLVASLPRLQLPRFQLAERFGPTLSCPQPAQFIRCS